MTDRSDFPQTVSAACESYAIVYLAVHVMQARMDSLHHPRPGKIKSEGDVDEM